MKTTILLTAILCSVKLISAQSNPWYTGAGQTLPEYVPLPMDRLYEAGQILQNRYDAEARDLLAKEAESILSHRELHFTTRHFKKAYNGTHNVATIIQGKRLTKAKVTVSDNFIQKF